MKQAKESFRERAAKLRQEKKEVENKENFQAPFQAAKFEKSDSDDSSSSSDDDDESIEEQKEPKKRKLAEASKLLQAKLSQRKEQFCFFQNMLRFLAFSFANCMKRKAPKQKRTEMIVEKTRCLKEKRVFSG